MCLGYTKRVTIRPRHLWIGLVLVGAVLVAITILIIRDGPDRTVTRHVTSVEQRRLCVEGNGGRAPTCATLDSPADARDTEVGNCVQMRYSAEGFLVALSRSDSC